MPGEVADLLLLVPLPEGIAGLDVVDAVHEERVLAVEGRVNQEGNLGGHNAGNGYENLKKRYYFSSIISSCSSLIFPFVLFLLLSPSLSLSLIAL